MGDFHPAICKVGRGRKDNLRSVNYTRSVVLAKLGDPALMSIIVSYAVHDYLCKNSAVGTGKNGKQLGIIKGPLQRNGILVSIFA
jgi:hypothetical protein